MTDLVQVRNLRKSYDLREVLRGVSFSIAAGSIFGLLGPNGAGKTTIIEILEGLRSRDSGEVTVAGIDPALRPAELRQLMGAQLQHTSLSDKVRAREVLALFGAFFRKADAPEYLLKLVGLEARTNDFVQNFSGGERQRLAFALALVGRPKILFLDEPTAGLDAAIRRSVHELIRAMKALGKTVLLTTHYIEEAEKLCDEVAILHEGTIRQIGPPHVLRAAAERAPAVRVRFAREVDPRSLMDLPAVQIATRNNGYFVLEGPDTTRILSQLARFAERSSNPIVDSSVNAPSLEDVYVQLTGGE